jgi:hypothetical protein
VWVVPCLNPYDYGDNDCVTCQAVVDELVRKPLYEIQEAAGGDGVPADSGFYAWWAALEALPGVPVTSHPSEPYGLLYVGIAPRDATSGATLRSRLSRQHIGGNVASSTFRFGLAALLWRRQRWTPRRSASGKYSLDARDNEALGQWQRDHLRLRWAVAETPWLLESDVVQLLSPPMNREHNKDHGFYSKMGDAREAFRAAAVPL